MKLLSEPKTVGDMIDLINPKYEETEPREQWLLSLVNPLAKVRSALSE